MTEGEWLACERPHQILQQFAAALSARKLRLFSCACCRRAARVVPDARSEELVGGVERYADGEAKEAVRIRASQAEFDLKGGGNLDALSCLYAEVRQAGSKTISRVAAHLGGQAAAAVGFADRARFWPARLEEEKRQAPLLRDIMGSPFRPARLDPRWLTPEVVSLAAGIYEERAFDRLPILGDALEETGCDNADALSHCRGDGPHVRGCWVVDLVLGKS